VPGKGEIMGRWLKKIKNKQYGQAMVEFALTLPIFLIAVLGVIELSRFFLVYSSVYTASREATRFASAVGEGGTQNYQNCDAIKQVAVDSGWFGGVNADNIDIYYESAPGEQIGTCVTGTPFEAKLGNRIVVDVAADYQPITPILPTIPVSTSNARTIMMNIAVKATPMEPPECSEDMGFVNTYLQYVGPSEKQKLFVDIINNSTNANYQLLSITGITWDNSKPPARYLQTITWGDKPIWDLSEVGVYEPPIHIIPITDPDLDTGTSFYFDPELNRNIPAGTTIRLTYIFDKNVPETIMAFIIKFQNLNKMFDPCTLSISY
jgi:Flp pilus assembly protein TadG